MAALSNRCRLPGGVNRLGQDDALKRVLGSDRIPHATTIGKFLALVDQQDKQQAAAISSSMLPRERRKVATLDWDSSIHEVYGQKKEGADFAYDNTWSYSALYGTLAETGDVLYPAVSAHQLRDQGSAAGNDRTGEQALSAGADATAATAKRW